MVTDSDGDGATCDVDCDDNDAARSPDFDEICDDSIDNDCNPLTGDDLDADGDGFNCNDDCNDEDSLIYPGAPEICGDSLDQDCDGAVDELAADTYTLGDSDSLHIDICSFSFPFCGEDWSDIYVQDNGRITFGFDDPSSQEGIENFLTQVPQLASLWTDLDPSIAGTIEIDELGQALGTLGYYPRPQELQLLFVTLDEDGSGAVEEKEFVQALPLLQVKDATEQDMAELFAKMDVDGSGSISYGELKQTTQGGLPQASLQFAVIEGKEPKDVPPGDVDSVLQSDSRSRQLKELLFTRQIEHIDKHVKDKKVRSFVAVGEALMPEEFVEYVQASRQQHSTALARSEREGARATSD